MHLLVFLTLFIGAIFILTLGLITSKMARKRANFTRSITLMLGAYGVVATEIFLIIYYTFHFHSEGLFHIHFYTLITQNQGHVAISILALISLTVIITGAIFFIALIVSQLALHNLSKKYSQQSLSTIERRLRKEISWLPDRYQLIILASSKPDAFTFSLLKFIKYRFYAEDWIILTTKLIEILSEEELALVIAHEYSHTSELDTRYSHLIFTITSLLFFDPLLRLFKKVIHERHEIDADSHAVSMLGNPKSLASALFKLLDHSQQKKRISLAPGFFLGTKSLLMKRIEILLNYHDK